LRTTLLLIHILAAGTWIGTNVVQLVMNPKLRTYPSEVAAWWMRRVVAFGTRIYAPSAVILLITGIFLVIDNPAIGFSATFVSIGFVMVIIGGALGSLVFGPRGEAIATAIEAGDDAEVQRLSNSVAGFGALDTVLLIVTVLAMISKWGV
jgi:hypothetical protein